jgi:hypothetical protein|tara:strand:- start:295 stop:1017 length:723 start_codon:yes stop_codon:yes gene_type:complete
MPKSLNPDQIAMLDKEVQKLDKKLNDKDKEKAMGMLMKKVGIKEADLDELSLSMKNITKSGISKNVGVDKDKLKMSLKDLRKKLDKKKDENLIVRSKKGIASLRRKSYQDNPHTNKGDDDEKKEGKGPCWDTHKQVGTKISSRTGRRVPNCVPKNEDRESNPISTSKKSGNFLSTKDGAGMTKKGVAAFRRKNPGSKLQTAVTGKVKPGSKDAKRRKSFCARSRGWTGERGKAARRRWKC